MKRHGLVYEDRQDGMRRLNLVRGLSNMFGQYNCFLNVIIQSLWHLPAFRNALLNLPTALPDNGASHKDAAVVRALHNVFAAFSHAPPEAQQTAAQKDAEVQSASNDSAPAQQLQQQEQAESSGSAAASEADAAVRQSVSPDELREALSDLEKGQSPVEFELSEMHDAAEVLLHGLCLSLCVAALMQPVPHACDSEFNFSCNQQHVGKSVHAAVPINPLFSRLLTVRLLFSECVAHCQSQLAFCSNHGACCNQVLGEVFNCLHRAQLGSAATAGLDPQLPQLVRVPRASSSGSLSGMATPLDPSARQQPASSMAQDIFGQKVQVCSSTLHTKP